VRFSYNAGVLAGITLVHLDVLAPNEEEPEVAVLVPDRVHAQMVYPPSYSSGSGPARAFGPLAPALPQRRRLHRPARRARAARMRSASSAEDPTGKWRASRHCCAFLSNLVRVLSYF
jgi:hypothetical protein